MGEKACKRGRMWIAAAGAIAAAAAVAVSPSPASSQIVPAPDTSQCPSHGSEAERLSDPLEGPVADDELEDNPPQGFEAPASAAAAAAPNASLAPTLRPAGDANVAAPASADAQTVWIEHTIRWCIVQRTSTGFDWTHYDALFNAFRSRGIAIRAVRIVHPPKWATDNDCDALAATGAVKMCPPLANQDYRFRVFAGQVARRYGPGSTYGVRKLVLWNEPNIPQHWGKTARGTSAEEQTRARSYAGKLHIFSTAAKGTTYGNPQISIDAGEIAAGSGADGANSNDARPWAQYFTEYMTQQGWNGDYDTLTIHPYSENAAQVPIKAANYNGLPGTDNVAVTEVAWGVDDIEIDGRKYRCMVSESAQAQRFGSLVDAVQGSSTTITRLVWFSVVDTPKPGGSKCPSTHYSSSDPGGGSARFRMSTFGLYKRPADGAILIFTQAMPRPLLTSFRQEQP